MEFPFICPSCRNLQMVDMEKLENVATGRIRIERGYHCENCKRFNRIYYTTVSLNDAMEKLKRVNADHQKFPFYFAKTLRKAIGIQER